MFALTPAVAGVTAITQLLRLATADTGQADAVSPR